MLLLFLPVVGSFSFNTALVSGRLKPSRVLATKSFVRMHEMAVYNRRQMVAAAALVTGGATLPTRSFSETFNANSRGNLVLVSDPSSYSALAYAPKGAQEKQEKLPLIVVLHGAGKNEKDAWSLADPKGEHAGLAPSLLANGRAPPELADNFAVIAPYSAGKRSFYEEPRKKVLGFVDWVCSEKGRLAGCPLVDPTEVFLFGFSDGATVGIELMTSGRFKGGVFAAYGFTGELPALAIKRLKDVPIWIFHSADDVIFPVKCSDKLVSSLRKVQTTDVVRYTRYGMCPNCVSVTVSECLCLSKHTHTHEHAIYHTQFRQSSYIIVHKMKLAEDNDKKKKV